MSGAFYSGVDRGLWQDIRRCSVVVSIGQHRSAALVTNGFFEFEGMSEALGDLCSAMQTYFNVPNDTRCAMNCLKHVTDFMIPFIDHFVVEFYPESVIPLIESVASWFKSNEFLLAHEHLFQQASTWVSVPIAFPGIPESAVEPFGFLWTSLFCEMYLVFLFNFQVGASYSPELMRLLDPR